MRALTHALDARRLHHAYLFTGTRGVGKTTLARILAKSLNCVGPDGQGGITARRAASARPASAIDAGRFVDYIEMDAASNRGVDEMTPLLEQRRLRTDQCALQGLHDRRSAHAHESRLQRDAEDAGRAARPRQVHPRDHRSAEDPGHGAVPLPAVQPEADDAGGDPGQLADILQAEGVDVRTCRPARPRASRARQHARRAVADRPDDRVRRRQGALESVQQMLGAVDHRTSSGCSMRSSPATAKARWRSPTTWQARSLSLAQALQDLASLLHRIALAQLVPDSDADDADAPTSRAWPGP